MSTTPQITETSSPGAVRPASAKPVVWWLAGGMSLLGVGALAAALVTGPKNDAPANTQDSPAKSAANGKSAKPSAGHQLAAASVCTTCGTVESVKTEKHKGEGTGLGAVGGAVLGGVVGHQMGDGNGKKALTVLRAVVGGIAGNEVEKQARSTTVYQVQVRMDNGSTRTVTQAAAPAVGSRVEIQGNQLKPLAAA